MVFKRNKKEDEPKAEEPTPLFKAMLLGMKMGYGKGRADARSRIITFSDAVNALASNWMAVQALMDEAAQIRKEAQDLGFDLSKVAQAAKLAVESEQFDAALENQ